MTDEEFREYNLRSNKNLGEWNRDLLANLGEDLLLKVGFDKDELDNIFGLETEEGFDVEKEFENAIKNPKGVKKGDLWKLGEHKLIIEDCTKKEIWERLLGDERFDFMFTDPPYKLKYTEKKVFKIKTKDGMKLKKKRSYLETGETDKKGKAQPRQGFGKNSNRFYEGVKERGVPEFDEWLSIANEYQNPVGASVMIFENWKNTVELWQAIEKYWKMRNMVIWHTPNRCQGFSAKYKFFSKYDIIMLADKNDPKLIQEYEEEMDDYLEKHGQKLLNTNEIILYGSKGKSSWSKVKGTRWARMNDHITSSVETGSGSGQSIIFGTKPIQILIPYIKILSPREGIVMEPFCGSGSTIIASEIMKRKCRAIELSPLYGEVIIRRFENFTGKKAVRI